MKKKSRTKPELKLDIKQCPYCGCKALHKESLTMCCSKAILKTLGR